jgi:hypothetical protein
MRGQPSDKGGSVTTRPDSVPSSLMEPSLATPGRPTAPGRTGATLAAPPETRAERRHRADQPATAAITVAELAAFGAAGAVGIIALASLAAAHLGIHSLGSVFGFTALAVVVLVLIALLRPIRAGFPAITADIAGLAPAAATGVLALWMFLPGFHYVAGDKDPGMYVMHAYAIARGGSVWIHDPLLAAGNLPVQLSGPGARFPAVWISDAASGTIFPQFYHLWPALLATSYDIGGYGALVATAPLLAVLSVVLTVLIARRIAGVPAAWIAGLLMATNMMQVWQAKYPTTEILSQVLFLGALLGLVLTLQTGWRWPALVAGLLVSIGYLGRPDGLLIVLLGVAGLATLWVLRRWDSRATWFGAGLAVVLPYGLWQAYGPAEVYTIANDVPSLRTVLALLVVCVVGALVLRRPLTGLVDRVLTRVDEDRTRRRLGLVATAGAALLFLAGVLRPRWGPDYFFYGARLTRSYDELNLQRLSWFFTWPGLLLMLAGAGLVALRRWSAPAWLVAAPTVALLALYAWHARNSPYFMWVGRRFVPTVLPGMVVLIALALTAILAYRWRGRLRVGIPVAVALLAFLGAVQLHQSLPLRSHDEWAGSYGVNQSLAALSGDQRGVYLWQPATACCAAPETLFAPTVWLIENEDSALLPTAAGKVPAYVRSYVDTFPDRPIFLVYPAGAVPPALPALTTTVAGRFAGTMPHWVESSVTRPSFAQQIPYDFTVYRVGR